MCGLQASHVREELVSGAGREGEQDLVYGEIKPTGRRCFFASLVSLGWHPAVPLQAPAATRALGEQLDTRLCPQGPMYRSRLPCDPLYP